ncbi:4a-hydroxytetrahydrobiopterin dehydratase [Moraxella sp. FZLJ2107]|uniref:4a-hydroxytetrahydrobiopterin dehydratase n=1 Tax=unclassified Moraxella TaxID=2685852 RepID=UPI00209C381E|nr:MULTISPECIES: 4a-hydroxytetrahydrobiopterin dehydratase [unclassified Moraxella]USZ13925.1 4a-hydroxytetrahydrobiopterin dehydratase [Moraxella sp. FZFQ2102]UTO04323.1 4a-hydroxytetrahydrobiopterin dehydratase [Moraxella sp. FZLJ2107]UTO23156.1 4a-hydroxytetrahydrobiopterin dehydratase [Moraxella sp. FZLJ2109]
MSSLTPDQVALQLDGLPNWSLDGNSLIKTYTFEDFATAVSFMVRVAFFAQSLEHYPVWSHDYNVLSVRIGDPSQHAVQSRDVQLAKRMESSLQAL